MVSGWPIQLCATSCKSILLTERSERMVLPLWRSLHSLNLMLPKEDRKAMLLRLYNEDTPLMDHSKDRFLGRTNGAEEAKEKTKTEEAIDMEADLSNEESESDTESGGVKLNGALDAEVEA